MITSPSTQTEDLETTLMTRASKGDDGAFTELVSHCQARLIQFFTILARDPAIGEDLAQEVFLRLYRTRRRYRQTAKFRTYVNSIARNLWVDYIRGKSPAALSLDHENCQGDPLASRIAGPAGNEPSPEKIALRRGLLQLSHEHRMVMAMHLTAGLTQSEIAEELDVPIGTVKSRMHHAVKNLKTLLGN